MAKRKYANRCASSKKKRKFTDSELRFIIKIHSYRLIYLDNALLGYKTDEPEKRICGDDFLRWVKKNKIETVISFINIYELRPLFIGKIIKVHPDLAKNVLATLDDFKPVLIPEDATSELAKNNKNLWLFLTGKLKFSDQDAAHFVMAVASSVDLFVSFNKRAFQENHKKIKNKLIALNLKMPEVWTLKDIQRNLQIYKQIMSK